MKTLLLVILALSLAGCATAPKPKELQDFSSGHTGCQSEAIKVSNWTPGYGYSTWEAECKGTKYRCTASLGGSSCKPAQ